MLDHNKKRFVRFVCVCCTLLVSSVYARGGLQDERISTQNGSNDALYVTLSAGDAFVKSGAWSRYPSKPNLLSVTQPLKNYANTPVYSVAIGYKLGEYPIRMELNYDFLIKSNYKWKPLYEKYPYIESNGAITSQVLLLKGYYDFNISSSIVPYIGLGVGYHKNSSSYNYGPNLDTISQCASCKPIDVNDGGTGHNINRGLSYSVGAGFRYAMNDNWLLDADLTYIDLQNVTLNEINPVQGELKILSSNHLYTFNGTLGITYQWTI
jgi:opacity protein-like surface antigen